MDKLSHSLRLIDLLVDLPPPYLKQLAKFSLLRKIQAGETIFCQGEPSPYCFGILSGQITIQRVPREKNFPPKILSLLGPGSLFGEQALFKESPRTAMAVASQSGELIAIDGKQLRDWMEKDWDAGMPLMMGVLQTTLVRLRRTSHELSLVYGAGRFLASDKPMKERCRETADFLRASLEDVDEITLYQRSSYWDEFEPVVSIPADSNPGTLPAEHPLVKQVSAVLKPIVPEKQGGGSTSLIPLMDPNNTQTPLLGFLWVTSKLNPKAFSPHILLLLDTVAVQFAETLLRHRLQEDQEAQARLKQGRQSYTV